MMRRLAALSIFAVAFVTGPGATTTSEPTLVDQAQALYEDIGLVLPDVEVRENCDLDSNPGGVYFWSADEHICLQDGELSTLVHEFAHAWDRHNLDDEARQAYIDFIGPERYQTWLSHDYEYTQRGGESFARQMEMHLIPETRTESYNPEALAIVLESVSGR